MTSTHLRRSLGVVLQDNFLFSGTIRDNISAAKPHATFDEVVRAARLAGAEEFIDRLPRGYETHIYEGSPNLSGGQRQRLAIARALIVDPRILILDEATSALDPDSEAIVNENIRRIARGRTVIVISHRLSSLVNSDAILVLERGKVVDLGKHYELLESCDIYAGLWNQQNRHIAAASRPYGSAGSRPVSPSSNRFTSFAPKSPANSAYGSVALTSVRQFESDVAAARREATDPRSATLTIHFLASLFLAAALVSDGNSVDRVVSEQFRHYRDDGLRRQVFQALDPSIIKSIDVKEGQRVEKGQLLATLDPTFADIHRRPAESPNRQSANPDRP